MPRPADLPDFTTPPLDEVVLGAQFGAIPGYTSVDAWPIRELFRQEFPQVEEQPQLSPQFETFGGVGPQGQVQFHFGPALAPNRLLFVSDTGNQLLQFQQDRFLTNWRKNDTIAPYPRFEQIAEVFDRNLRQLSDHVATTYNYALDINQAEITYVNIIPVNEFSEHSNWLKLAVPEGIAVEAINASFAEVIRDSTGKPFARLHHDFQSAVRLDGTSKALRLNLTYRGKPADSGIEGTIDFLRRGREAIVNRFTELTTKQAHSAWKRVR